MAEQDGDTWYCFYAVMKLNWNPETFAFLPPHTRALMYAFIDTQVEQEKKQQKRIASKSPKKSGGVRRRI